MAKGQKRSSKEVRKPKADKIAPVASSTGMLKGLLTPIKDQKKSKV